MDLDFSKNILIFTDGACSGNPGPGGFGAVIAFPDGRIKELGGGNSETTNNQMEMGAVIRALAEIRDEPGDIWILTDSTYTIRGITQWIWGWKKKGWVTSTGKPVNNIDLWKSLEREVHQRRDLGRIEWKYVRGHSGTPGNERCDEIAVAFSKKKFIELYDGPLLQYPFSIHDIPDDLSLPPMRSPTEKKSAFSYLSYVNGQLQRHNSWSECEAQVKGRSGAKFKKTTSSENEKDVVKGWGIDPKALDKLKSE